MRRAVLRGQRAYAAGGMASPYNPQGNKSLDPALAKERCNMACYHCSVKILSRSAGRSSVQFSAYMGGQELYDERLGMTYTHTSKEEVCYNEMIFADRVPENLRGQEVFWNAVEAAEKQMTAQVARTWEIALPHELTMEQNLEWARKYAQDLTEKDGMPAVQIAIHKKDGNWHAHLMAPTRDMDEKGKWLAKEKKEYSLTDRGEKIPVLDEQKLADFARIHGEAFDLERLDRSLDERGLEGKERQIERQKVLDEVQSMRIRKDRGAERKWQRETVERNPWNSRELLGEWRERAADYQNRALELHGHEVRVDHRSLEEQGIDREPTIHEGYTARLMGEESERVRRNIEIRQRNMEYKQARIEYEHERTLFEKAQTLFEEWKEQMSHVREQIAERIRGIGARIAARANGELDGRDRDGVEPTFERVSLASIRADLDHQRAAERAAEKIADDSGAKREERELEQQRLAAEKVERELERSREITHHFGL